MKPTLRGAALALVLGACVPKAPAPAWQGAEVLAHDAAPMGVTADQVLARHVRVRTWTLEWDALPADLAEPLDDLGWLQLDVRKHPSRSPSRLTEADPEVCPAPPCFLVPVRVRHDYAGQLTGVGNGVVSVPDRDPDTWRLVPLPAGLKAKGPLKRRIEEAHPDAFWIALTSFVDPEPTDGSPHRALLMVNLTYDNGVRQDGLGTTLAP